MLMHPREWFMMAITNGINQKPYQPKEEEPWKL
jgi:hypothetical protein